MKIKLTRKPWGYAYTLSDGAVWEMTTHHSSIDGRKMGWAIVIDGQPADLAGSLVDVRYYIECEEALNEANRNERDRTLGTGEQNKV